MIFHALTPHFDGDPQPLTMLRLMHTCKEAVTTTILLRRPSKVTDAAHSKPGIFLT